MKIHTFLAMAGGVLLPFLVSSGVIAADAKPTKPASAAKQTPDEPVSPERVDKLVRQLGDRDYATRERAQEELLRLGFQAYEALNAATTDSDLEIASRAKYLLRLMRIDWTIDGDSPVVRKTLHNYEYMEGDARQWAMFALARLPDGQGAAALCRLARYEKSSVLSKDAAIALIWSCAGRHGEPPRAPSAAVCAVVRKAMRGSPRPAAAWLLAWTQLADRPDEAMKQWDKIAAHECDLLRQSSHDTEPEIVSRLLCFQTAWLKKLGKKDAAKATLDRLIAIETGEPERLYRLCVWMIERKEWASLDDAHRKFANQFAKSPCLLYLLAEAAAEKGDKTKAETIASRALGLSPEKTQEALYEHFRAAQATQMRGQFAWARREYQHIIDAWDNQTGPLAIYVSSARGCLSEMLHDQGDDLAAAAALEKLVRAIEAGRVTEDKLYGNKPGEIRAHYYHYLACHWESKHDRAKQREFLHKALEANPEDTDALIDVYRLPEEPKAEREKVVESIHKAAATLHDAINEDIESAHAYNNYAWLVGNTEGDLDEALRCSLKSLELRPEEPGFLDTLAHVYFTRGQYAEAFKCQERAVELMPHSGSLRRSLERFRAKVNEKKS